MTTDPNVAPSARAAEVRAEFDALDLTPDEVAYIIGMDRATVLRYCRDGILGGYRMGRKWRIPKDNLRAYLHGLREATE